MEKISIHELNLDEFKELQKSMFKEVIELHLNSKKPSEEFLSRKEAAKFLNISLPTLDKLTNEGKIRRYAVGNVFRYKRFELESAFDSTKRR